MPTKIIVDCSTGISTEVELTAEEIAQMEADAMKAEADRITREAEEQRIIALKASAKAKLISGEPLTEEEVSTIVF